MASKVALVTGGNGITGSAITEFLVSHTTSEQWTKIIVTSRSPAKLPLKDPRLVFLALDFTQPVTDLVQQMRGCCHDTTHAFFSSYVHRDDFADLASTNCALFEHFLLALNSVAPSLQNITLQTGGKHYNLHLHPVPTPVREDDDDVVPAGPMENFYHRQQSFLAHQQKTSGWTYNVIRPQAIIGVAYGPNGMNSALCFAVYFIICSYLGVEARMPTNERNWAGSEDVSSATLIADLSVYTATTPKCANQAFNATNGDHFVWRDLWCQLAAYFGAQVSPNHTFSQETCVSVGSGSLAQEFSFVEWIFHKKEIWDTICDDRAAPEAKASFDAATWAYQDWVFRRTWTACLSMDKARGFGFKGWVDSYECFIETFRRFEMMGIIPRRGPKNEALG